MEILDTGSHIKGTDNPTTSMNFSCRIPRDSTIGNGAAPRNKSEADIQLLLACKTQLSSEVIRWKTETLRLQKERDAARIRMKELDHIAGKLTEKTKELENRLVVAEDENRRLRKKMLGSPGNMKKVQAGAPKFHSYPWSETSPSTSTFAGSCPNTLETLKDSELQEDWKEVSQQLLERMKREMKEIAEISNCFSLRENKDKVDEVEEGMGNIALSDNELEECVSALMTEHESLKQCLLQQNKALTTLINDITQGKLQLCTEGISDASKSSKPSHAEIDQSVLFVKPKTPANQYSRHSDESFKAFFTKHLDDCQNLDKISKTMELFMQTESQNVPESSRCASKISVPRNKKPQVDTNMQNCDRKNEEERVCPICEASFHKSIPQNKFEEHVFEHLEAESASLLDQYVVL